MTSIINQIFNELSQIPFNDGDHLTDLIARYMKSKSFLAYYAATAKPYEMTSGATYAENYIIEMLDRGDLVIMESRGLTFIVDGYGRYGGDLMIHCSIGGGHTFFNTIGWHWSDSFTYYESYIVKYGLSFITNPDWDAEMGTNRPLDSLVPTNPGFSGTRSGGSSTSATFKP